MPTLDLSVPSNDTPTLLRQWLAVYKTKGPLKAGVFFTANRTSAAENIVLLTANILAHGDAYYKKGDVTPSLWALARKLAAKYPLNDIFMRSLTSGDPEYAWMIGVAYSNSVIASTAPKS